MITLSRGHVRYQAVDDEQARYLEAVLGALGYEVERVPDLGSVVQARAEQLAAQLDPALAEVMHAMLVTDDAASVARMLGMSIEAATYREQGVARTLGVRGRLDLLRRLAGIEAAERRCA